jgi:hypothetical protein
MGERVNEKRQKEELGGRTLDCSTREGQHWLEGFFLLSL